VAATVLEAAGVTVAKVAAAVEVTAPLILEVKAVTATVIVRDS
jgi:hypothetical protein